MAYHYRSRTAKGDGNVGVVILILIAGMAYAHRTMITRLEHYSIVVLIATSALVGLVAAFRLFRRTKSHFDHSYLDITAIDAMDGLSFERYIANLLRAKGYSNVRLTEEYDYGVDIIAEKDGIRWGIQCKRYSGLVKADAVRQVVTALKVYKCDRAMVITNSVFGRVARNLAEANDCLLIGRGELSKFSC